MSEHEGLNVGFEGVNAGPDGHAEHEDLNAGFVAQPVGAAGLHAAWYEANAAAGRLTAQRCACGVWRMPARYRCAACHGDVWTFEPVTPHGAVHSWTVTHRPFHFGFAEAVPYALLIVEVAEGVRFLLHARPRLAALPDGAVDAAIIGTNVGVAVDEFGLPHAILPTPTHSHPF